MIKGIYAAALNLHTKNKNMEIVANNLANINTTGYKREIPFSEIMNRETGNEKAKISDLSEGNFIKTSNPLDLSLKGEVFFLVKGDNGVEYTRNGKFSLSEEGFIVNDDGAMLLGAKGEINVNESVLEKNQDIIITKNGEIKVGDIIIDQLAIARTDENQTLERKDGMNFAPTSGMIVLANEEDFEVHQGYLEESNVNPILEMQSMLTISKEFEATQKTINFLDQSLDKSNEIGKV